MAGASLLALLDDIATVLDDVAVLTKVAAKKTAGVLGDDLALNAQQVSDIRASRELPVVWAVAKGSMLNKAILVPAALAISALIPWAILPLLMAGGLFLCFEGFEKVAHKLLHRDGAEQAHQAELTKALQDPEIDMVELEQSKIKGAVRTDFILSAEIIVIALGIVAGASFILAHVIPGLESWFHRLGQGMGAISGVLLPMLLNAGVGIVAGALVFGVVSLIKRMAK